MFVSTDIHQSGTSAMSTRNGLARSGLVLFLTGILGFAGCAGPKEQVAEKPATIPAEMSVMRADISLTPLRSLNSSRDDFGISVPLDSSLIFFTSNRSGSAGTHSVYWSHRTGEDWQQPELAVVINNAESNGTPSIAPGAQTMFFTGCNYGFGDCDLYRVESGVRGRVDANTIPWTVPRNLGIPVNTLYWDSQPCVSADGSVLFFSSDRPGGYGGRDIWVCLRTQEGTWGEPFNAGNEINTVFDEMTPWITPDCRTLFFASNGHPGIGGYDIFFIELDPEAGLIPTTSAYNMGRPVNSTADDIALSVSPDGSRAFLSSNRSGGLGGYDMYELNRPPVELEPVGIIRGTVRNSEGKPLLARIEVSNLNNGNVIGRFQTTPETGEYAVVVRKGGLYAVTASAPGRLFHSRESKVPDDIVQNGQYYTEHILQPIHGQAPLLLFFDPGSSILRRESIGDLNRVVQFLKDNPALRIEIGGHTDATGEPAMNQQISLERAESVKAFLTGNRISDERIEVKGYGQEHPIADNTTEDGRSKNRRVEMKVIE